MSGNVEKVGMVERGAEAMRAKRRELIAQPLDRIWPDLMRAAIEAMREPTEEMIEASYVAMTKPRMHVSHTPSDRRVSYSIGYRAMISAALSEEG